MFFGFSKPSPNKGLQYDFFGLRSGLGGNVRIKSMHKSTLSLQLLYVPCHETWYFFRTHQTLSPGCETAVSKQNHPYHSRLSSLAFLAPLFIQQQSTASSPTHHFAVGELEENNIHQLRSEERLVLIICTAIVPACSMYWPGLYYMRFSACVKQEDGLHAKDHLSQARDRR